MIARWQAKWIVKDAVKGLRTDARRLPRDFEKGYFDAAGGLVGLVISDNLLGITKTPFGNELALVIGSVASLVGILSRNRQWGYRYRKRVMSAISWMFASMGLIVLGVGGERQLGVFAAPAISLFNFWVAIFLLLAIVVGTPFFMAANWAKEAQDYVESRWKRRRRVSAILNQTTTEHRPNWPKWSVIIPSAISIIQLVVLAWLAVSANSIAQNAFLSTQNQSFSYSVSDWNFTNPYSIPQQDVLQFKTVIVSESLTIATCCPNGKVPNLPNTDIHFSISVDGNLLFDRIVVETHNATLTPLTGFSSSSNPGQVKETFTGHWLVVSMSCIAFRPSNDTWSSCSKLTFLQIQIDGLLFHY